MTENLMNFMQTSKVDEEQLTVLPSQNINEQIMHSESKDEGVTQVTFNCSLTLNQHVATLDTETTMLSPTPSKANNNEEEVNCNNKGLQLEIKENVSNGQVQETIHVLTSDKNKNECNVYNYSEHYSEKKLNKVDDIKSSGSNHHDNDDEHYTQCVNDYTTVSSFPHSPSCITVKTVLPLARPPSRLPHKTPMSSKSATPISTLPSSSPATVVTADTSPKSICSMERLSIITPPSPTQNNEVKSAFNDTHENSILANTNEKHSSDSHFIVTDSTNGAEIVQTKVCERITHVQNSEEVATSNTQVYLNNVNGNKDSTLTGTIVNENINNNCKNINNGTHVLLQRKRLHEYNASNNNNSNEIKTRPNVKRSSTSHLFKETSITTTITAVNNNSVASPVNSPSSLIHYEEQQSQKLRLLANRHQRKLQNWSELLVKAIMQHEVESHVNIDSVRELCTRIAHAIPGDAQAAKDTLLMLLVHLRDPENGELRQRLITGTLPVEVLITMDEHDLVNPRRRRKLDEEFEERAKDRNLTEIKKAMQTTSRLFACPVCKERDCSWYQKQTRSADEPMTIFCTCNKCNTTWKRY